MRPTIFILHAPTSLRLLAEQCGLHVADDAYEGNASQFIGSEQYAKRYRAGDTKGGALRRLKRLLARR